VMMTKATVVGSGAMATVAAQLLAGNEIHVAMLTRESARAQELLVLRENRRYLAGVKLAERILPTADAQAAFASTELIVSAVPCQFLRASWERYARQVAPETPVCSVTKGLEQQTYQRPSEIITEFLPQSPVAVLSGPCIAAELARCLPATVVVASAAPDVAALMQTVFGTSWFRVYTNADVLGVELAAAVKNVIALAAGILDGLHAGDNAKAALLTRGLVEITRLGIAMGAKPETFTGLAGIGDLITTCVSPLGRNRSAGERIGGGVPRDTVVRETLSVIEGIPTTQAVLHLAARFEVEMPITRAVYEVLFENKPALAAITELMRRPPKAESRPTP
jgi:glycerol-3-phosphate dehydrogenase (NAD(P)+)